MEFIGEHIWVGMAGKVSLWAALIFALSATICYGISCNEKLKTFRMWRFNGRTLFRLHTLSLIVAMAMLLHIVYHHFYEYSYAWKYSSNNLGFGYLLSALWAGQEGSLLVWIFFQAILALIVSNRAKTWEMSVMTIISFTQFCLLMALAGIEIGAIKIGSSPFVLLREIPENIGNSFFTDTDYLKNISDGLGLNPLLMNFWMKIHPPLLFLGFAAMLIPFSYALASLIKKDYSGWLKPVLPWASFSALFLGMGLFLGGVWAYEDLTFGGFWAWDPVENSSLVPWMFMVAAIHLIITTKRKIKSLGLTYSVVFLSYILVLYSSYLTRSGILSNTSVHAFAGSEMSMYMLVFLVLLFSVAFFMLIKNLKLFPKSGTDYALSKEFWMFIGAVLLILSAFQILFSTSLPVINKMFSLNLTLSGSGVQDSKNFYNNWQLPFATLMLISVTICQYLLIGKTPLRFFIKKIAFSLLLSIVLSYGIIYYTEISEVKIIALVFSAVFISISVIDVFLKYDYRFANKASLVSHFGFGLFILGIVMAFYNSTSLRQTGNIPETGKRYNTQQYVLLSKDSIHYANPYYISYSEQWQQGNYRYYNIDFLKKNEEGKLYCVFSVAPSILKNKNMGNVTIPDTKHYLNKDIFTYVYYAEKTEFDSTNNYTLIKKFEIKIKDTINIEGYLISLKNLTLDEQKEEISEKNVSITAHFEASSLNNKKHLIKPKYIIKNSEVSHQDAYLSNKLYKIRFEKVSQTQKTIECGIYKYKQDFILIRTMIFPYVILVWIGAILMLTGFIFSYYKRIKKAHSIKKDVGIID